MGFLSTLPDLRVPSGQQQTTRLTDFRFDESEITGGIEQARIPPFPVGQQQFDLVAQTHCRNVTEPKAGDNAADHKI